jgi:ferrous iron transport protein B
MAPAAYFLGITAILISGMILKKFRMFIGKPSPFIMELPPYHVPHARSVMKQSWERIWEFIRRAGTIILLACVVIWFLVSFDAGLTFIGGDVENSVLASFGDVIAPVFGPLGWGDWQSSVATLTGLISKEAIVASFGVIFGADMGSGGTGWDLLAGHYTELSAFSFLIFNLLCAPCVAAIAALRKELGGWKEAGFAIAYQCGLAYAAAMTVFQIGSLIAGDPDIPWLIVTLAVLAFLVFLIVRPEPRRAEGTA